MRRCAHAAIRAAAARIIVDPATGEVDTSAEGRVPAPFYGTAPEPPVGFLQSSTVSG